MNLYDMFRRKDRNIVASPLVTMRKETHQGCVWRGLTIAPGGELLIKDVLKCFPFRQRPSEVGWFADSPSSRKSTLNIDFISSDYTPISSKKMETTSCFASIVLPWPIGRVELPDPLSLRLSVAKDKGPVFVGVHKVMTRERLIAEAIGNGVELGPGHAPQIMHSQDTKVIYLEQKHPEDWAKLYSSETIVVDKTLWEHYRVGEAHAMPIDNGSLDFIFSSHVFEHLVNPIGHLVHWHEKLKSGGVVLGVIPDLTGSKDFRQVPSPLQELQQEYAEGIWQPTEFHYRRFVNGTNPQADALEWMRQARSIHAHFYTRQNMVELLEYACRDLGYRSFNIEHQPNHKDFHFVLVK